MSIKSIAEAVGVSASTVSRVLNHPDYRCSVPGLREKIWKTAMEQNYVPNESARNLKKGIASQKSRTCYINILVTRTDAASTDPLFSELLRVIESEIHENSCILSKIWYDSLFSNDRKCKNENLDRIIQQMHAEGKGDGLVIIGRCSRYALTKLNRCYKSVVSINRSLLHQEVDEVSCDGRKIAALAVEHLISLGHRNIGYVGACHNEPRYEGYLETLRKHDLDLIPEYVVETRQTEAEGYQAMETFLQSDDCPTGIYCANDISAIGMLKCIGKYRKLYYVPSVISSDDIDEAQYTRPMLTTVRLPKREMGKFAVYLLLDRLKGGHSTIVRTQLEGQLMVRNSCFPVEEGMWSDYCI